MEMHLLPTSPTDSQAHHLASEILTHIQCSPIPWVSHLLCVERGEHCRSLSAHLSCHSWKDQENMLWDCAKPPPLITNGSKSVEVDKPVATRDKNRMCFPRSSLFRLQHSLQCCTNIQLNIPEAYIRSITSSWISELDFL